MPEFVELTKAIPGDPNYKPDDPDFGKAKLIVDKLQAAVTATPAPPGFSGAYADLTGKPTIPAAQVQADWSASAGMSQIMNKPSIPAAQVQPDWNASSGMGQILNKPTIPSASTIAVNAPLTNAGTTTAANLSVSAATTGAAGSMSAADKLKLDGLGAAWVFSTPTFANITTAQQLSASRNASVRYDIDASISITLLAGQSVTATLTYADNSGMTTNPVVVSSQVTQNSGVLGLATVQTLKLEGDIPPGKYRRVTFATTGTGTVTPSALKAGQEVLK